MRWPKRAVASAPATVNQAIRMPSRAVSLKASLAPRTLSWVEDQLSNNDDSSNEELMESFLEAGLTAAQAQEALNVRSHYQQHIFEREHTPLRVGDRALRFDAHAGEFVPWMPVRRPRPR